MSAFLILSRPEAVRPDPDVAIIADRFSWAAFYFGVLWMLLHRLWLEAAVIIALRAAALWAVITAPDLAAAAVVLWAGLSTLVGLEAQEWRARRLIRRGYRLIDLVEAPDADTAFELHLSDLAQKSHRSSPPAWTPRPAAAAGPDAPAIGLVPWQKV